MADKIITEQSGFSYKPRPSDDIPTGICECGCGKATRIAARTERSKRRFKGFPMPFVRCHSPQRGAKNHHWKGGRYAKDGYVMLYAPDHPNCNSRGYISEHRVIWERFHGRLLLPTEEVHYKNEVRNDNRPENLEALSVEAHRQEHHRRRGKTRNRQAMLATLKRHPGLNRRAGKAGTAIRWKGHIKNDPNCLHCLAPPKSGNAHHG